MLQVFWLQHRWACRQIVRRCHQHAVSRRQLACHDALGQLKAAAKGRVEALANQIDLAIVEMPIRADIGVAFQKLPSSGTIYIQPTTVPMLTLSVPTGRPSALARLATAFWIVVRLALTSSRNNLPASVNVSRRVLR